MHHWMKCGVTITKIFFNSELSFANRQNTKSQAKDVLERYEGLSVCHHHLVIEGVAYEIIAETEKFK